VRLRRAPAEVRSPRGAAWEAPEVRRGKPRRCGVGSPGGAAWEAPEVRGGWMFDDVSGARDYKGLLSSYWNSTGF